MANPSWGESPVEREVLTCRVRLPLNPDEMISLYHYWYADGWFAATADSSARTGLYECAGGEVRRMCTKDDRPVGDLQRSGVVTTRWVLRAVSFAGGRRVRLRLEGRAGARRGCEGGQYVGTRMLPPKRGHRAQRTCLA